MVMTSSKAVMLYLPIIGPPGKSLDGIEERRAREELAEFLGLDYAVRVLQRGYEGRGLSP